MSQYKNHFSMPRTTHKKSFGITRHPPGLENESASSIINIHFRDVNQ
jgi:hypothetical protein